MGYKGGAPAVLAVLASEVLYAFENLALVMPHIVRAL
jgi:tripartite-type tricarboxylate transporter receptor subunit TctC